jgi:hypothetical protein
MKRESLFILIFSASLVLVGLYFFKNRLREARSRHLLTNLYQVKDYLERYAEVKGLYPEGNEADLHRFVRGLKNPYGGTTELYSTCPLPKVGKPGTILYCNKKGDYYVLSAIGQDGKRINLTLEGVLKKLKKGR